MVARQHFGDLSERRPCGRRNFGKGRETMSRDSMQMFRFFSLSSIGALLLATVAVFPIRVQARKGPPEILPASQSSSPPAKPQSRPRIQHETFSSPKQAAEALYNAARSHDENAMIAIFGPDARDIVIWTDSSDDRNAQDDQFAKKYQQMHRLVKEPDNETTLYVGAENWPLPIPIVERDGNFYFDCLLGRREIMYRRIGQNEMSTLDTLRAIVDAENQYYANSAEAGSNAEQYAQHLTCSHGQHDGLFSPDSVADEDSNAIGLSLARASYDRSDREPFHGYFFRILTAQGPHSHRGARDYVVNGKMTGGFAIIAFPAAYRSSGAKTFVVSQDRWIFEKDLGPRTTQLAAAIKVYDPDSTWTRVRLDRFLNADATP
jgi:hypothetical protein